MAFSAGPYGAALNDGSEYDGSYASKVSEEQIMDFHAKRLHVSLSLHLLVHCEDLSAQGGIAHLCPESHHSHFEHAAQLHRSTYLW